MSTFDSRHPAMRVVRARGALEMARERCPHWDMEEDSHCGLTCCNAVVEARDALMAARAALKRQADA